MEDKRIVEINGIRLEVDMRTARRVDEFRVGDNIKILDTTYSSSKIYDGVIIDFLNFKNLPSIQVATFENGYYGYEIKFLVINANTENLEILPSNPMDFHLKKNKVIDALNVAIEKAQGEVDELTHKKDWFIKYYGKYFEGREEE